jgi:zeaxanthin glucosyltransferase
MKLALICPAVTGHLNPMTQVARELQWRGHDVTVVALVDASDHVVRSGLKFAAFGGDEFPRGAVPAMTKKLGELDRGAALAFTIDHYRREAVCLLTDFPTLQQQHGFDAVVTDQTMPGGTAAEMGGLPFITLCHALPLNPEPAVPPWSTSWSYDPSAIVAPLLYAVNGFRLKAGLVPIEVPTSRARGGDSPLAIISQQPPSFDFPRSGLPPHFHYAGPFLNADETPERAFPWERLDDRPLIYASMGTLQNGLKPIFHTIATAVSDLPAQLVITLGRPGCVPPSDLPGDPIVVPYAPQRELLRRASLSISHAGMNTVLESLACGVPLVTVPITNDQPANAARVSWLRVGQVVPLSHFSVTTLREAVRSVLQNTEFRQRAKQLQSEIRGLGGARRAVSIIETALSTKRPVLRETQ